MRADSWRPRADMCRPPRPSVTSVARVTEFEDPPSPPADGQVSERFRGPVRLRGDQREQSGSTTDQRLLDSRGPSDWVHTDPWRVLRIQAEFVEGFGARTPTVSSHSPLVHASMRRAGGG